MIEFIILLILITAINTKMQNSKITDYCFEKFGKPNFTFHRYGGIDDLRPYFCYWKVVLVYDDFMITNYRGDITQIPKEAKISSEHLFSFLYPTTKYYHIEYGEYSSILLRIPLMYFNKTKDIEEFFSKQI